MVPSMLTFAAVLQHPVVQAVQFQASLVLLVGIVGWTISGCRKRQEAQRLIAAGYAAAIQQLEQIQQYGHTITAPVITATTAYGSAEPVSSSLAGSTAVQGTGTATHSTLVNQPAQLDAENVSRPADTEAHSGGAWQPSSQQQQHGNSGLRHRGPKLQEHQLTAAAAAAAAVLPSCCSPGGQQHTLAAAPGSKTAAAAAPALPSSIFKSQTGQTSGLTSGWPPLAVICPVKGCREHSRDNWATQLAAYYGGPRVFVFAVESEHDPAVQAVRDMMQQQQKKQREAGCRLLQQQDQVMHVAHQETGQQQQQQCVLNAWHQGSDQQVLLVDAGLATTCSQKIHNILAGIEVALAVLQKQQQRRPGSSTASSGGYVCILDDDVALHPISLMQLADELEHDAQLFMVTGYPHDIVTLPNKDSSSGSSSFWGRLCAYAVAAYHLPLCIGFSVADRGGFVWGGVMMLRAEYLAAAAAELAAAAEPVPAAATADANGGVPDPSLSPAAVDDFGGQFNRDNILRVWRDGGYSDDLLLSGFCAAHRLSIGLPVSACFPQLLPHSCTFKQYWNYLRRQLFVLDTYYSKHNKRLNHTMMALHSYGSALFTAATVATTLQLLLMAAAIVVQLSTGFTGSSSSGSSGSGSWRWVSYLPATAAAAVQQYFKDFSSRDTAMTTTITTWIFAAATAGSLISIWYLNNQVRLLFNILSPTANPEVLACRVSVVMLWLGWTLENLILPYCTLYCYICDHIVWGGILYHKKHGKVDRIMHAEQRS